MRAAGPCVRLVPAAAAAARRLQRIFFLHEGHDLSRFLVRASHSRINAVHGRALVAICCNEHLAGHLSKIENTSCAGFASYSLDCEAFPISLTRSNAGGNLIRAIYRLVGAHLSSS